MKYTLTNDEVNRLLYILRNLIAQQILQEWNPHIEEHVSPIDNPYGFNDAELLDSIWTQMNGQTRT